MFCLRLCLSPPTSLSLSFFFFFYLSSSFASCADVVLLVVFLKCFRSLIAQFIAASLQDCYITRANASGRKRRLVNTSEERMYGTGG